MLSIGRPLHFLTLPSDRTGFTTQLDQLHLLSDQLSQMMSPGSRSCWDVFHFRCSFGAPPSVHPVNSARASLTGIEGLLNF